jgi:hypothetical protein
MVLDQENAINPDLDARWRNCLKGWLHVSQEQAFQISVVVCPGTLGKLSGSPASLEQVHCHRKGPFSQVSARIWDDHLH